MEAEHVRGTGGILFVTVIVTIEFGQIVSVLSGLHSTNAKSMYDSVYTL